MAREYRKFEHEFVTLQGKGDKFAGTFAIMLVVGRGEKQRVWVNADYHLSGIEGFITVGDGQNSGTDDDGCCIVSVPIEAVAGFWTEEEAESIEACEAVDEQLLAYAIG